MNQHKHSPSKKLLKIHDVADTLKVKKFVIKQWEQDFMLIFGPHHHGQRLYTSHDLKMFLFIKELLYAKGLSVEQAKAEIAQLYKRPEPVAPAIVQEAMASAPIAEETLMAAAEPSEIMQALEAPIEQEEVLIATATDEVLPETTELLAQAAAEAAPVEESSLHSQPETAPSPFAPVATADRSGRTDEMAAAAAVADDTYSPASETSAFADAQSAEPAFLCEEDELIGQDVQTQSLSFVAEQPSPASQPEASFLEHELMHEHEALQAETKACCTKTQETVEQLKLVRSKLLLLKEILSPTNN